MVAVFLYCVINTVGTTYFYSHLILFTTVYFAIGYMKRYLSIVSASRKVNLIILTVCIILLVALETATYLLALKTSILQGNILIWTQTQNPLIIGIAISAFNLVRECEFYSKIVNKISALSLLVYLIHENLIVRDYIRVTVWNKLLNLMDNRMVVPMTLEFTIALFAASLLMSLIYDHFLQRLIYKIADKIFKIIEKNYQKVEGWIIRLH